MSGVDDVYKLGLERSPTDQEPVNVGLGREVLAVLGCDRTPILDSDAFRDIGTDRLAEPFPQRNVDFLRLLFGGGFSGADCPDGLVSYYDVVPVATNEFE